MQADTCIRIRAGKAVLQISLDGATHGSQLTAYLMMTAGFKLNFEQKITVGGSN
ncbi:MAG: hypothetical protein H6Q19_2207 [Bacteroidetes bacterium]|nr:hypothetical protein [Bacteroidota bacterium]